MTIIGIIILFLVSSKVKIKEYPINKLSKEVLEQEVKITGKIKNLKQTKDLTILTVEDKTDSIKVVLYEKNIELKLGLKIEVIGKFKVYQKEFEIEANEVNIL